MESGDHVARFMERMDLRDKKQYFEVVGITSECLDMDKSRFESNKHVAFFDIEESTLEEVIGEMINLGLLNFFIFESSDGNFHVINPRLRSEKSTYALLRRCSLEDEQHAKIGLHRGDWVLRLSDKEEIGKEEPTLVYQETNYTKDYAYSKPHLEYIKKLYGSNKAGTCLENLITEGKQVKTVKYWTFQ